MLLHTYYVKSNINKYSQKVKNITLTPSVGCLFSLQLTVLSRSLIVFVGYHLCVTFDHAWSVGLRTFFIRLSQIHPFLSLRLSIAFYILQEEDTSFSKYKKLFILIIRIGIILGALCAFKSNKD